MGFTMSYQKLFSKIQFARYDLFIPFICRRCGKRCRTYLPHFTENRLKEVATYLDVPFADCFRSYREMRTGKNPEGSFPCPFFSQKDNKCRIYPLRPDVCRLYPFSFGGGDPSCPEYSRHLKIIDLMTRGQPVVAIYDSAFCPVEEIRPVPVRETWKLIRKFHRTTASETLLWKFILMNGLFKPPHEKRKNTPAAASL